ncbi:MAG: hypothetical protein N2690_01640 [Rhodocyclaceae bacterium]|nr:hypothetical protein [Rhodocyclaceae bacterium]
MRCVQAVLWLLFGIAAAADPTLAELAAQRSRVRITAGEGLLTAQRADDPQSIGEPRWITFAVSADGRYDIVRRDPADPDGERTRFVCDGRVVAEISQMTAEDPPVIKRRLAENDSLARLLACVRLDLQQLEQDFQIELTVQNGRHELRLVPRTALARDIALIVVTLGSDQRPRHILLDEPSGTRHRLEIERLSDDPPLTPGWFVVP